MRLPTPEGPAAIQLSIAKITDALISGRIDPKRAGQLLYAMQIASQHLESHRPSQVSEQVKSMTTTAEGEELAPDKYVCDGEDDCNQCDQTDTCTNWCYVDDKKGDDEDEEDEDDADEDDDALRALAEAVIEANKKR